MPNTHCQGKHFGHNARRRPGFRACRRVDTPTCGHRFARNMEWILSMADPTPAPITNEVINSLNGFVVKGKRKIDPLELRRLRRKIDELAKVSRYEADVLHGILAVYENDEERMRSRFANAIALRPNDEWVISNYVKALRAYGLIYDALECARKLVRVSSSADALSDYLALVSVTLEFEDAEALYERVRKAHT